MRYISLFVLLFPQIVVCSTLLSKVHKIPWIPSATAVELDALSYKMGCAVPIVLWQEIADFLGYDKPSNKLCFALAEPYTMKVDNNAEACAVYEGRLPRGLSTYDATREQFKQKFVVSNDDSRKKIMLKETASNGIVKSWRYEDLPPKIEGFLSDNGLAIVQVWKEDIVAYGKFMIQKTHWQSVCFDHDTWQVIKVNKDASLLFDRDGHIIEVYIGPEIVDYQPKRYSRKSICYNTPMDGFLKKFSYDQRMLLHSIDLMDRNGKDVTMKALAATNEIGLETISALFSSLGNVRQQKLIAAYNIKDAVSALSH